MKHHITRRQTTTRATRRQGTILAISAAMLVMIFGFVVFTVDVGYITLTKAQLQAATDSATHAAVQDLERGLGMTPELSASELESAARDLAVVYASAHSAGGQSSVYLDPTRDIQFGQITWDSNTGEWVETLDVAPYNFVQVTAHRDQGAGINGDSDLQLFFGPVIQHGTAKLSTTAAAGILPGNGFQIPTGSDLTASILPIAYDLPSWESLLQGVGADDYSFDESTGMTTSGFDGILEINIYPESSSGSSGNGGGGNNGNANSWTPGNRGTVDLGSPNNATPDLERQITSGLNADDLSYFGGELSFVNGPIEVNGDPGISAGIKDELTAIIGQPRAIPIFSAVTGNGNNTTYTLVKFVGVRILAVKLTGGNKYVICQPATLTDETVVPDTTGTVTIQNSTIFTSLKLLR